MFRKFKIIYYISTVFPRVNIGPFLFPSPPPPPGGQCLSVNKIYIVLIKVRHLYRAFRIIKFTVRCKYLLVQNDVILLLLLLRQLLRRRRAGLTLSESDRSNLTFIIFPLRSFSFLMHLYYICARAYTYKCIGETGEKFYEKQLCQYCTNNTFPRDEN